MDNIMQINPIRKLVLFHVGIVVNDLPAAIKKFSAVFGIQFGAIQELTMNARGAMDGKISMKVSYSTEGPVHLKLIQGSDKNQLFSLKNGEGLHHLGVWCEEYPEYQERDPEGYLPAEIEMNFMPGDPVHWYSCATDLCGTRLEFMNIKIKNGIEAWIRGEDLT